MYPRVAGSSHLMSARHLLPLLVIAAATVLVVAVAGRLPGRTPAIFAMSRAVADEHDPGTIPTRAEPPVPRSDRRRPVPAVARGPQWGARAGGTGGCSLEVVDVRGRPAASVRVLWRDLEYDSAAWSGVGVTDRAGRLELPEWPGETELRPDVLGAESIVLSDPPALRPPRRLVVPDSGSVEVRIVDLDGRIVELAGRITLTRAPEGEPEPARPREGRFGGRRGDTVFGDRIEGELTAGVAVLGPVAVGTPVTAEVALSFGPQIVSRVHPGPARADERATVDVSVGQRTFVSGRLQVVGSGGELEPFGDGALHAFVSGARSTVRADEEGRFVFHLERVADGGAPDRVRLVRSGPASHRVEVDVRLPRPLPSGLVDTGVHTLTVSPVLVEGEVRDAGGEAILHARVRVEVPVPGGRWRAAPGFSDRTGAGGRFCIRGRPEGTGALRLAVEKQGYRPPQPVFLTGQERVHVVLVPLAAAHR